ncbi:ATP-binding protein [Streptomyces durbertensis]|uniref:ATP-binding protein n=2 Tax=Streptomyces durbertensis TaxID=2448886 RepID=A0ABR6ELW6_9ACTN|nr:ATP-binding protein [Streptomyces durbertensis]
MLPAPVRDFTGRAAQTAVARRTLCGDPSDGAQSRDLVITGPMGTGKSALAMHAARLSRAAFPDGQLHADLGGETAAPREPTEVLGWFLRALGVPEGRLPASQEERGQLYRSLLAGRRMLVVLDNAVDDRQVRPLLPGDTDCRALVTGRRALASLEGTRLIVLGAMEEAEALRLLSGVIGERRVAAEWEAARRIVRYCDRLPLALRAAAARLVACPERSLALLAARLAPASRRLDELRAGSLDMRAALEAGYRRLSASTRAALGALARSGAPCFDTREAAAVLAVGERDAEEALEELLAARLVEEAGGGQPTYVLRPLVRLYAVERADGPAGGTPGAVRRVVPAAGRQSTAAARVPLVEAI